MSWVRLNSTLMESSQGATRTAAIDFGGTTVKYGAFDSGVLIAREELPIGEEGVDLAGIAARVDTLLGGSRPVALGIAVPGIVDPCGARLVAAHGKYADLLGVDLCAWSSDRFGCPAVVENDARAALVGEVSDGVAVGASDVALIVLGTGIGTAAMIDGRVVRGSHGHGSILGGHVTVDLSAPRCPCGNFGCAEALASTWALASDAAAGRVAVGSELAGRIQKCGAIGIRDLIATRHEPESAALLERYLDVWAAVIVTHCHAFDPEVVVLSGGVMRAADILLPALRDRVHANLWSSSFRPFFVVPDDPSTSVLRGVAALATTTLTEGQS